MSNRELAQKLIRSLARFKWHLPFKLQRNRNHKIKTKRTLILLFILTLSAVNQTKATTTTTIPAIGDIFINEFVPDSDTEWVELYNSSATDLDISRHYLDDIANGGQPPKQIPDGTIIPANGYYVMEFNAYFNNNGDAVRLLAPNQTTVLDTHTYTSSTPEKAWSRAPDGQQWRCVTSTTPTKGSSNPANSKIYPIRQLAQLGSTTQIDPPDAHAQVEIIQVDAATVMQADGITPVAGDHSMDPIPPSENDYSIALKISYGQIDYITAGDSSGKYDFRYNDVESVIAPWIGPVEILHVNHHGSGSSSNQTYLETLAPATAFIS